MSDTNLFNETGVLFAKPSFWTGIARLVDMFGTLSVYNESSSPEEADAKALYADWLAVGNDMRRAIRKVEKDRA